MTHISCNVVFLNRNYADYYNLTPENVAHLIVAVKNDNTEEFDEDEDKDNSDDENLFINMYLHMDILDAEPDGDDNEDELDLHDVNHPNYMPPHVQSHLLGPHGRSVIYKHFIILTQECLRNKMKMSF
jgi:hypothetical protein